MSVSTSQPPSRSGFASHGFPPAPKSVRLWPVVGPSREHDDLAPADPRRMPAPKPVRVPTWAIQAAVTLAILALGAGLRWWPVMKNYLGE